MIPAKNFFRQCRQGVYNKGGFHGGRGMNANDWEMLGIPPGSSVENIKSAFRRKVGQCHPDVCPEDDFAAARLRDVVSAYRQVLSEAESTFRSDSLFKTPLRPLAATLTIQPSRKLPSTVGIYTHRVLGRCHQSFQMLMLVVVLTAPVATVVLGSITLRPVLYRALQGHHVYVRPKGDPDEIRMAIALIKQQNADAGRMRNVSTSDVKK